MIVRVAAVLCVLSLLSGCSYVLKAGHPARQVQIHIPEIYSTDLTVQVGRDGAKASPNLKGIVELELPEVPRRCDTYLFYPAIPWQRHPVPDLFVMRGDRVIRRVSLVEVHHEAESSAMPIKLPHE